MSLSRLNRLLMSGILPFNFGVDHAAWVRFYDNNPDCGSLCSCDPRSWDAETIERVNKTAQEEQALYARLMALPEDEFCEELRCLEQKMQAEEKASDVHQPD